MKLPSPNHRSMTTSQFWDHFEGNEDITSTKVLDTDAETRDRSSLSPNRPAANHKIAESPRHLVLRRLIHVVDDQNGDHILG